MPTRSEQAYLDNVRLSQLEYEERHVFLYSRPRCLGLVLGNACNIDCVHCYQSKNGDNLLRPPEIAAELRRELIAFYPYASTLRIQGGEVFAIRGFRELVDDISRLVDRPIISISTNGTLIDDEWAERMVRVPFSNVTVSIDGGTRATYNRLRKGADLDVVLANIDRIHRWKANLESELPHLDAFFVVMRSNFREIPQFLELMSHHGMVDVALQTMELSPENTERTPTLEADESISDPREVRELHAVLMEAVPRFRQCFRLLRLSGLQGLFERENLDTSFLAEGARNLYPDSEDLATRGFELCPNPWTTLFLVENGDAHLCFISEPIGNLYAEPVASLWNSPRAIAKRSDMIAGRYLASGCSSQYCGWREGKSSPGGSSGVVPQELFDLVQIQPNPIVDAVEPGQLALVRKLVGAERRKREQLEVNKRYMESLMAEGQKHIDHVENQLLSTTAALTASELHVAHLEATAEKAIRDFRDLETAFANSRKPWAVRAASRAWKVAARWTAIYRDRFASSAKSRRPV